MFTNLLKATVATALLPVTATVDLLCMPGDAHDGENFAPRTRALADTISENVREAIKPEKSE